MRLVAAIALLAARTALAQAPGDVAPAPTTPTAPPAPAKSGLDAMQLLAASNHGLVGSTALTVEEGQVELTGGLAIPFAALGEINAGLTRSTEVWVDAAGVIDVSDDGDGGRTYGAGIKQMIVHGTQAAIALTGSVRGLPDNNQSGYESVGAVATVCADASCNAMLSGGAQRLFGAHFHGGGTGANAYTLSVSLGRANARLLADLLQVDGDRLLFIGMRYGKNTIAVDVAIATELGDHDGVAVPWVAVSARL